MKIRRSLGFWALAAIVAACNPVMLPTPPSDVDLGGIDGGTTEEEQPNPDEPISVTDVKLNYYEYALNLTDQSTVTLIPDVLPRNATNKAVKWRSDNHNVASVDTYSGEVTAHLSGDAKIEVMTADGGETAACWIHVSANARQNIRDLSVAAGDGKIILTWNSPTDTEFDYAVIQCNGAAPIQSPTSPTEITGLINGTTYALRIKAHYTNGDESGELEVMATPAAAVPSQQLNLNTMVGKPGLTAVPGVPAVINSTAGPTMSGYDKLSSSSYSWQVQNTSGDFTSHSGDFGAGKVYRAVLVLKTVTGYNFTGLGPGSFTHPAASVSAIYPDDTTATVTLTFPPTATVSVSGTISGPGGGLAGATVQLMSGNDPYLASVTTAGNGTYTINGVSAGSYTIAVSAPTYAPGTISSIDVTNANVTGKDLTLTTQVTARNITNIITPPTPAVAPVTGAAFTPEQSAQYTGSVSWKDSGGGNVSIFEPGKIYTATCTLTARTGWSFAGLTQGNFIYTGPGSHTITSISATQVTLSVTYPPLAWTEVTVPNDNGTSLPDKLQWIRENGEKGRNYIIALSGPETIPTQPLSLAADYETLANTRITIKGNGNTIRLNGSGALFSLYGVSGNEKITLVLEKVTLMGRGDTFTNSSALVVVDHYANLETNNTTISGNKRTGGAGGGVYVYGYSSFTMNGGEISNNTAHYNDGGGVYVNNSSSFTMNEGAIISNNTADYNGGGVYVYNSSFTMNEGAIISNNTADGGGGVYLPYGTFTMAGGEISGNTAAGSGGGVYANITSNSYYFRKTGGILYGDTNTTHTSGSKENTATSVPVTGNGNGHAVYVEGGRKRNSDAFENDDISTDGYGTANGWE